jgi:hypothetical protein
MIYLGIVLLMGCLLCFLILWLADSRDTWVITPFMIFAALEIVSLWPSTIFAYYTGLSRDAYPILVAGLAFACFLSGFSLFRWLRWSQHRVLSPHTFLSLPLQMPPSQTIYIFGITLTTLVLLGMSLYHYQGIPPAFHLFLGKLGLTGDITTEFVHESRKVLTKAHIFGGSYRGQGLITTFMRIGWPFLLAICLVIYDKTNKKSWLMASILFLLFTFVFVAGDGTRAPFLFAMIYIMIVISMLKRLKTRFFVTVGVILFVLTITLSIATGKIVANDQEQGNRSVAQKILKRIALDNGIHTVQVIEFVESGILDHRYGEVHWQKVILALPGKAGGVPFSRELSVLLNKKSTTSFSTTTYLATIYVDYGLAGVMIFYLMIGCLFGLIQQILYSIKETPLRLILSGYTTFYLGMISLGGFVGFVSSYVVVIAVFLVFMMGVSLKQIIRVMMMQAAKG